MYHLVDREASSLETGREEEDKVMLRVHKEGTVELLH